MLFWKQQISVQEYTPIALKKYLTGNGKADKMLVQKIVMRLFNLSQLPKFNDTADALGLAYLASKHRPIVV
jgi:crossover junction endodeoxyribonuclease RuvC